MRWLVASVLLAPAVLRAAALDLPENGVEHEPPGSVEFVGTATVLVRYGALTLLTDPNFLHRGERAHLGYGLTTERLTDPAVTFDELPPIDLVLLSHLHGDHFDHVVAERLDKQMPIVTNPAAADGLRGLGFERPVALAPWESLDVRKGDTTLRVTATPGRHGPVAVAWALPDVNGTILELAAPGHPDQRVYVTGDTLVHEALAELPERFPDLDLALLHLGGTRIAGVLVTMDAEQGVRMLTLVAPRLAIPIHYDDYEVFKSPLAEFVEAVRAAGLESRVRVLERGERHAFAASATAARR
jgi:L-ascorbate metabolism protein UlaG (beta-lactamase superfamily)